MTYDDSTANNNDGTVTNATWTTDGKYDGALDFDGTGDYVTIPVAAVSSVSDEITIAFLQYGSSACTTRYANGKFLGDGQYH